MSEKLVRDEIPRIIKESGKVPNYRTVEGGELGLFIKAKVMEEAQEVFEAESREELIEELADLTSVIDRLMEFHGIEEPEVYDVHIEKGYKKGFFQKGYVLELT